MFSPKKKAPEAEVSSPGQDLFDQSLPSLPFSGLLPFDQIVPLRTKNKVVHRIHYHYPYRTRQRRGKPKWWKLLVDGSTPKEPKPRRKAFWKFASG